MRKIFIKSSECEFSAHWSCKVLAQGLCGYSELRDEPEIIEAPGEGRVVPEAPTSRMPDSKETSGTSAEQTAIDRIRKGRYSSMPEPERASAAGGKGGIISIENGTSYAIHVYFSGPVNRTVVVSPGDSANVSLSPGRYQVAAEAPASSVLPFYGVQNYQANMQYKEKFYIEAPSPR